MYLKKNRAHVVDNVENLPIIDLRIGDEVVYLSDEKTSRSYGQHSKFTTVFMLLTSLVKDKEKKIIMGFESVPLTSSYRCNEEYTSEEDEPNIVSESASLDRLKEEGRRYLVFPNNTLFELERDNIVDDYSLNERENIEIEQYIYSSIFEESSADYCLIVENNKTVINNSFHRFFYMKLSNNSYLTFILSSTITPDKKYWLKQAEVKIFFKDKTVIGLPFENLEKLFKKAKQSTKNLLSDSYYTNFENSIKIHSYNIEHHMTLDSINKEKMIQEISKEFGSYIDILQIRYMFKPAYVNEEFKLEVYPIDFDTYHHHPSLYVDGKKMFCSIERRESNGPFYEEYRKAKEIFNYELVRYKVNGLNPYDGKLYDSDGNALEDFMSNEDNYFIDYSGIIVNQPNSRETIYYVRFKDVYVLAYKQTDTEAIDDLIKRHQMIKNLDKAL